MFEQLIEKLTIGGILLLGAEVVAVVTVACALLSTRTAAGAWGWSMALIALPFVAVPAYWVFGRQKFHGYGDRRREVLRLRVDLATMLVDSQHPHIATLNKTQTHYANALTTISKRRFTRGNRIRLLKDGENTFNEIFEIIASAKDYVLVQFFIIKNDDLGTRLQSALSEKARQGVRIYLLYDEIGSYGLTKSYIKTCRDAGIYVEPFHSTQGRSNRFQINFRNHRKIVIADGLVGTCGGHNVGDEYLGKSKIGPWRDTTVSISGPAVTSLQMVFLVDWYWATRDIPELDWAPPSDALPNPGESKSDANILVFPFGPVEHIVEGGTLFFLNAITRAKSRVWIASPYFVPDSGIVSALQLAALSGVDVRIMIPNNPDKWTPYFASFSFLEDMEGANIQILRYQEGFMHQKMLLVDNEMASVGTANLDNRSMRLNFEVNIIVCDQTFCKEVKTMFENDFKKCKISGASDYHNRPWWFRLAVRVSRLASPIL